MTNLANQAPSAIASASAQATTSMNISSSLFSVSSSTCNPSLFAQSFIANVSSLLMAKLNSDNYLVWMSQFLTAVMAHRLHLFLDNSVTPPDEFLTDSEGKSLLNPSLEWITLDQQLLSCLFASISEPLLPHVLHCTRSIDAWLILERKFASLSRYNVLQLKSRLQTLKKGELSITEYLRQFKVIVDTLASVSSSLDDEDIALYILNGLPLE